MSYIFVYDPRQLAVQIPFVTSFAFMAFIPVIATPPAAALITLVENFPAFIRIFTVAC
jgi:hypothetical protein